MAYEEHWLSDHERALMIPGEKENVYSIDVFHDCSTHGRPLPGESLCIGDEACLVHVDLGEINGASVTAVFYWEPPTRTLQLISLRARTRSRLGGEELLELREKAYAKALEICQA